MEKHTYLFSIFKKELIQFIFNSLNITESLTIIDN